MQPSTGFDMPRLTRREDYEFDNFSAQVPVGRWQEHPEPAMIDPSVGQWDRLQQHTNQVRSLQRLTSCMLACMTLHTPMTGRLHPTILDSKKITAVAAAAAVTVAETGGNCCQRHCVHVQPALATCRFRAWICRLRHVTLFHPVPTPYSTTARRQSARASHAICAQYLQGEPAIDTVISVTSVSSVPLIQRLVPTARMTLIDRHLMA